MIGIRLALIAVVALGARALVLWQLHGSVLLSTLILDGRSYDAWAQRIAAGDWIGSEVFYQSPLYSYFLAGVYTLGGRNLMLVRVIQAGLGACSCLFLAWTGRRFFDHRTGQLGGLLLALYPPAIFFDCLIQKAAIDLWLLTLLLALLAEWSVRRTWPSLLAAGMTLGALTLNRENAGLLFPVLAIWIWTETRDTSYDRRAGCVATWTLGMALAVLPVGWRNYQVGGEFLFTTSQFGTNFYIGNHAGANGRYEPLVPYRGDPRFERADATRLAEQAEGRTLSPAEVSRYWLDRTLADILRQPGAWLRLTAWKCFLVFHRIELVDGEAIGVYCSNSSLLRGLSWLLDFGVIGPVAVLGMWATRRHWRRLVLLYAVLSTLAMSIALFFVFARYRFSLVPVVILFAAAGLSAMPGIVAAIRSGRFWRDWGVGCVLAGFAAVLSNSPRPDTKDEAFTYMNLGMGLITDGRPSEAIAPLQKAIEIKPTLPAAYHNLGRALTDLRRDEEAVAQYEQALRRERNFGASHESLGQYYATKDPQKAILHLRRAVALLPDSTLARAQLAEVLTGQGDDAGACALWRAARGIDPDSWLIANNLAWMLATSPAADVRDGAQAVQLAEDLVHRDFPSGAPSKEPIREAALLDTLAAAYAEVGRYDEAAVTIRRAVELVGESDQGELLEGFKSRLKLYEAGKPYRHTQNRKAE